jgi:hypothetical protein
MPLAVEEPALQEREDLVPREGLRVRPAAVLLEDADVVLERLVGPVEGVTELVPLEHQVLGPRLVGVAKLRIDRAADGPDGTGTALDPDHDLLLLADVVDALERPLGVPPLTRAASHPTGIQSRLGSGFKNIFSFLFSRGSAEEHVARYVVREHDRGRSLTEILEDKYVQNRLTPEQQRRLLDRPEIIEAFSGDTIEAAKASVG